MQSPTATSMPLRSVVNPTHVQDSQSFEADKPAEFASNSLLAAVAHLADFLHWAHDKPDMVEQLGPELSALAANHRRVQLAVRYLSRSPA